MFSNTPSFCSFSTNDLKQAQEFYGKILGLKVEDKPEGLTIHLHGGGEAFIYPKGNHQPASFTILNFLVADIEKAVGLLKGKGVVMESYEGELETDDQGIFRGKSKGQGPNIAWFKDPAGNFLSVIEE